jgi:hypothetical protein
VQLMSLTSGTRLEPYEIVAAVGSGAMGEVFRAGDIRLRELVFECGTHVGVNFVCGTQSWSSGGRHDLCVYTGSSETDELYDIRDADAPNLTGSADHAATRMIERLGSSCRTVLGGFHIGRVSSWTTTRICPGRLQFKRHANSRDMSSLVSSYSPTPVSQEGV